MKKTAESIAYKLATVFGFRKREGRSCQEDLTQRRGGRGDAECSLSLSPSALRASALIFLTTDNWSGYNA